MEITPVSAAEARDREIEEGRKVARNWRGALWSTRGVVLRSVSISQATSRPPPHARACRPEKILLDGGLEQVGLYIFSTPGT